jgi:hypothetical protein|uniref:Uncharacterized protein n=1 Tax=Sipha flava TaxID=143950 RepID=A0A2S2RAT9_9HEMI
MDFSTVKITRELPERRSFPPSSSLARGETELGDETTTVVPCGRETMIIILITIIIYFCDTTGFTSNNDSKCTCNVCHCSCVTARVRYVSPDALGDLFHVRFPRRDVLT